LVQRSQADPGGGGHDEGKCGLKSSRNNFENGESCRLLLLLLLEFGSGSRGDVGGPGNRGERTRNRDIFKAGELEERKREKIRKSN